MEVAIKRITVFAVILSVVLLFPHGVYSGDASGTPEKIELQDEAVSKKILENGLVILAKESPPGGLVAIDVKIKAGSSLESEYMGSGISHLVEHMLFKGTKTRLPGNVEREIKSYGGFMNGSVSQDLTDFILTVRSEHLEDAIAILKDIFSNATFDNKELEKEKDVILKEIKLHNDEPQSNLIRTLNETAYLTHPYKYPPIGYEEKFNALKREDLIKYYNKMYVPNNMVISVVGDIDRQSAIEVIARQFRSFRAPDYNAVAAYQAEGAQISKRELEKEMPINLTYLAMGFHSTPILSKDLFAADVLSMILGRGDNSRLSENLLKNKRIAYSVACWNYTPRDPGLFVIQAILDKKNLKEVKESIIAEIERLRKNEVSNKELESAKRMVLGDFLFARQLIEGRASDLASDYILTGSHDFSRRYVEGVGSVSAADVKKVANEYLSQDNMTIVSLVPFSAKAESIPPKSASPKDTIVKTTMPNGLRLLVREDHKTPTISITVAMLGGLMAENSENNGISNLTARMLLKGTKKRREDQITGAVQSLGGDIKTFSGFNSFGIVIELLKPDFDKALDILKDVLTEAAFPQDQIDKEKSIIAAAIKGEDDDIFQTGFNVLRKELFGNSAYALRYLGSEKTLASIKRQDLVNFYKSYVTPGNMVISVSGDVKNDEATGKLKEVFVNLMGINTQIKMPEVSKLNNEKIRTLEMDKEESLVLVGFLSTSLKDPDRYALDVMASILSGQTGRLFDVLRDKLSLAYTLGCVQKLALNAGLTAFYIATSKENIEKSDETLKEQLEGIRHQLAGDKEFRAAKNELVSADRLKKQTNTFFATTSALDELYGLGYDNLYKYESEIEKVTPEDVRKAADKYLDLKSSAEVIIRSK